MAVKMTARAPSSLHEKISNGDYSLNRGQIATNVDTVRNTLLLFYFILERPLECLICFRYDTGDLPGDHEGAAGLDCSMWSHIQRSWYFFATKKEPYFTESLDTLKLGQVNIFMMKVDL